jgi:hypothetical protein
VLYLEGDEMGYGRLKSNLLKADKRVQSVEVQRDPVRVGRESFPLFVEHLGDGVFKSPELTF